VSTAAMLPKEPFEPSKTTSSLAYEASTKTSHYTYGTSFSHKPKSP
jgi:hypothetical protein